MYFNEHFVKQVIPESSILYNTFPEQAHFSIDTRSIQPGELFVALRGNQTDGHHYIDDALQAQAGGIIIQHDKKDILKRCDQALLKNKLVIAVPDTIKAFMSLAHAWRNLFTGHIIGVTGSVGKTSTKSVLGNIFKAAGVSYITSYENQNTLYGLALNVLRLRKEHQYAVFEMGTSKRGEMAKLAALARPTLGIITYIGHAHMEGLGSVADIAAEKRSIFKYFKEDNIGIINGDQPLLTKVAYHHPVVKFGTKTVNQVQSRKIRIRNDRTNFMLKLYGKKYNVVIPKNYSGAVYNVLAAAAAANLLAISNEYIVEGMSQECVIPGRLEMRPLKEGNGVVINDCYNANPESVKAAFASFQALQTKAQKIIVIGDMLELGVHSPFWHRQIGRLLRKVSGIKRIILVGSLVQWTHKAVPVGMKVDIVSSWQEAVSLIKPYLDKESAILVKSSFGMQLKNLVDAIS